jgi:hypothetical protein
MGGGGGRFNDGSGGFSGGAGGVGGIVVEYFYTN